MSNLTPRGTIKGVIRSGGGGGVTDYDQLTGRPSINNELVTGDKSGHDYGLMNSNDIRITKIVNLTYGTNYDLEFPDDHVYITNQIFQPAGVSSNGTKGLVPRPSAGDNGKILSNEGWINPPEVYTPPNYSTTEQKTGQKGLNGDDIYFQTFTGTSSTQFTLGLNVKEIYGINGYILKDSYKFVFPYRDASDYINASVTPSNDVRISTSGYFSGGYYLFTIYYTKN